MIVEHHGLRPERFDELGGARDRVWCIRIREEPGAAVEQVGARLRDAGAARHGMAA